MPDAPSEEMRCKENMMPAASEALAMMRRFITLMVMRMPCRAAYAIAMRRFHTAFLSVS